MKTFKIKLGSSNYLDDQEKDDLLNYLKRVENLFVDSKKIFVDFFLKKERIKDEDVSFERIQAHLIEGKSFKILQQYHFIEDRSKILNKLLFHDVGILTTVHFHEFDDSKITYTSYLYNTCEGGYKIIQPDALMIGVGGKINYVFKNFLKNNQGLKICEWSIIKIKKD